MNPRSILLGAVVVLGAASVVLFGQRTRATIQRQQLVTARAGLDTAAENARLQAAIDRVRVQLERSRVRSTSTTEPHLALSLTDGLLTLERGDIVLRSARAVTAAQRGVYSVIAAGPRGILLSDSLRIEPQPADADTNAVPSRTIWLRRSDYTAVLPNVKPGHTAFLY